jgi:hypothetical protein
VDQLTLFPELVVKADELAFDFSHWAEMVRDHYVDELSEGQAGSLAAIEQKFATMARDQAEFDAELWTEAALRSSAHWEDVRRLAASALDAFAWPIENPPRASGERATLPVERGR